MDQVVATGSSLGTYGVDPVDGDTGYRLAGTNGRREVPHWTREKARTYSVTAYRSNPMATAVVDTYVSFCVGDSGVNWQATNPQVADVVREFWDDPANRLGSIQELLLRSQLLMGEKLLELMVAPQSRVVRFAPHDPECIKDIGLRGGNPLWPSTVSLPGTDESGEDRKWELVQVNDDTGLREGNAMFWAPWRTLDTDVRGMPFLTPILDWLDSYDTVLSNLIDRTALARYMVWDVTVQGGQDKVDEFVQARGGLHVPPSGSVEVHNDAVTWKPQTVSSGAFEDAAANSSVLTNIASGAGLSKTWLAEPDGANRATSQSMAEPVRRRVGGVQKVWLGQIQELLRFVVDQAVAAKRLPPMVEATDPRTGAVTQVPASQSVTVTGPEIAAADSQITAQVLLNLSTGLDNLVKTGALTPALRRRRRARRGRTTSACPTSTSWTRRRPRRMTWPPRSRNPWPARRGRRARISSRTTGPGVKAWRNGPRRRIRGRRCAITCSSSSALISLIARRRSGFTPSSTTGLATRRVLTKPVPGKIPM
jgi:hypothetical protein